MSGFISKIMNNSISGLNAQQGIIANISSNIANVNTPNYARRVLELQTRGGGNTAGINLGNGVALSDLQRMADSFRDTALRESVSDLNSAEIVDDFVSRIETLFSFDEDRMTMGTATNNFFSAVDDLTMNPSSLELRANFLQRATDLTSAVSQTYDSLAKLQDEADDRLVTEVSTVNSILTEIADLNHTIKGWEATGTVAVDERDQRDYLLEKLSEKMDFDTLELSDGSINVTLPNGFPLVAGSDARLLETKKTPSFAPGGAGAPPGLAGGQLSYITYDFSNGSGTADIDLTSVIGKGGGIIGGLLEMRGTNDASNTSAFEAEGVIVDMAARVEAMARQLLTSFNRVYSGDSDLTGTTGDRDGTTAGFQASSGDLDGDITGVFGLFDLDHAVNLTDLNSSGLAEMSDLVTYAGAQGIDSFASLIKVAVTEEKDVAAALDSSGGAPAAASFESGDSRNLEALSDLQDTDLKFTVVDTASARTWSLTSSIGEAYNESVSNIGNERNRSRVTVSVAEANVNTARTHREELSGVSLDEEFTSLIKFQKSFQASARLIGIADDLLEQLINIV